MAQLRDGDLVQAEQAATATETSYADAQRHNAAAAAAHGLHPGDDCSVCNRPLAEDWQPPMAEDFDTARRAHQATQIALTEERSKIRDLTTRAQITDNQATELQQDGDRFLETARTAAAGLARLIGRDEIDVAALSSGDEFLHSLSGMVIRAGEELATYDSESQQLREQRAAAQVDVTNAQASLKKIRASHSRNSSEAAVATQELRTTFASLPDQLRVDVALPTDPLDVEVIQLGGLDAAYQMLDDRARELDHRGAQRKQLQHQLDTLAQRARDLDAYWTEQVLAPGHELVETVNRHRDALAASIGLLNIRDIPLQPAASLSNPAQLADIVRAHRESGDAVIRRTRALAEEAQTEADAARHTIARLATELAIPATDPHPADPDQVVACASGKATEADVEARAAEQAAENFSRLVAPLAELRRTGEELSLAHKVLRDLSAALKPGAFPKWLTLRRSRALLIHASRLLEQMSGGHYAFAELDDEDAEWRVIDNDSGLDRTPASLSGGEQFIASLALALGMVEMMARSGGRLESLWLDEGFGSLDRSNLDTAIEALASVAARGRMVAVISHVRAVADQVTHVLAVTRGVTGTQASWLNPHQRSQIATGDLESDTASALSGLLD
jgi:DNA repair protein SbcC/Rad50